VDEEMAERDEQLYEWVLCIKFVERIAPVREVEWAASGCV
jgi:hypothetical protein